MTGYEENENQSQRRLTVFLCHSSHDKPMVRALYQRLVLDGFSPWLDEEDLLVGQDWQQEIPKAVRRSDIVVVCLSKEAVTKSGYVQKEIKYALDIADEQPDGTIFIVPLKLEECDVPDRLKRWHWVDYFEERGYERLIRTLKIRAQVLRIPIGSTTVTGDQYTSRESKQGAKSPFDEAADFGFFRIGNIEIPAKPILGSPETPFRYEEVKTHYRPRIFENLPEYPETLRVAYRYLLDEVKKKYNIRSYVNNILPRIDDAIQGHEQEGDRRGSLDLYFSQTTYESLWATNVAVDIPMDLPNYHQTLLQPQPQTTSIRKFYCKPPYNDLAESILSNAPGVEIIVISRSELQFPVDQLIIRRRSQKVAGYRGWFQSSASGHMSLEHRDSDGNPNPFITAITEARQEIADGLLLSPNEYQLVGIILKWQDLHPAFHGFVETNRPVGELIGDFKRDTYEGNLFAIPFEPLSVLHHIATEKWFPTSALAVISSLLAFYPRQQVEEIAKQVPIKKASDFLLLTN